MVNKDRVVDYQSAEKFWYKAKNAGVTCKLIIRENMTDTEYDPKKDIIDPINESSNKMINFDIAFPTKARYCNLLEIEELQDPGDTYCPKLLKKSINKKQRSNLCCCTIF